MRNILLSVSLLGTVFSFSTKTYAQDEFEEVRALDHARYSLTKRIAVDADFTFLPIDAYYKPLLIEGAVSYQPADFFSWEIGRIGYSLTNINTGLDRSINNQFISVGSSLRVKEDELRMKDMRYHASSTAYFNLLYSKSNFFNKKVVYYYWQVGTGVSYYDFKHASQVGADLALRVRFFIDDHFSFSIRGGQTIGFKSSAPKNITFLGFGAGFAF
ncbi:MAG: hypothetical protein JWQ35_1122 [Bacteriovoracaceae bacterium]|nr:hypothetical protein [Bacteriovoracaceae bacterium]